MLSMGDAFVFSVSFPDAKRAVGRLDLVEEPVFEQQEDDDEEAKGTKA